MDYPLSLQLPDAHSNRPMIVDRFGRPIAYVRPGFEDDAQEIVDGANRDADPARQEVSKMTGKEIREALTPANPRAEHE